MSEKIPIVEGKDVSDSVSKISKTFSCPERSSALQIKALVLVMLVFLGYIGSALFIYLKRQDDNAKSLIYKQLYIVVALWATLYGSYRLFRQKGCELNFREFMIAGSLLNPFAVLAGFSGGAAFSLMEMFNAKIGIEEFKGLFPDNVGPAMAMAISSTLAYQVSAVVSEYAKKYDTPRIVELFGHLIGSLIGLMLGYVTRIGVRCPAPDSTEPADTTTDTK